MSQLGGSERSLIDLFGLEQSDNCQLNQKLELVVS